jgi:hypothetical protein
VTARERHRRHDHRGWTGDVGFGSRLIHQPWRDHECLSIRRNAYA